MKRFVCIWFRYLKTDWYKKYIPGLSGVAFALAIPHHGRMIIDSTDALAAQKGITTGMAVADAKAIHPALQVLDDKPGHAERLLKGLAEWCIRYSPCVSINLPDGLILDATGVAHLWGGEEMYLADIGTRMHQFGYTIKISMADTIGAAWAASRFSAMQIIEPTKQNTALLSLPAQALRLKPTTIEKLNKLGLRCIKDFLHMPRPALRRRFGQQMLLRIDQALGIEEEFIEPVQPIEPYYVRLPCLEPIQTRTGIEIGLQKLLQELCERLKAEGKGLRNCTFKAFRIDGKIESLHIGTNRATHNQQHIFKLFEIKLDTIEPALGIDLFLLEAQKVEPVSPVQEKLWEHLASLNNPHLMQLLDRLAGKFGEQCISRYIADEHYWPERSFKRAVPFTQAPTTNYKQGQLRPVRMLKNPEPISVTAPIPDYPPMNFRYQGKHHKVIRADGPERIEQEWWLQQGEHRDYYCIEDEEGLRYWVFRLGHYGSENFLGWFIHGFFA